MKNFLRAVFLRLPTASLFRQWIGKRSKNRKQERLALIFRRLVAQNKLLVEHSEIISGWLIALDRKNKKLLLIDQRKSNGQQHCVSLPSVSTAVVEQETSESGSVRRIFLVLKQKQSDKTIRLCFFDEACNGAAERLRLLRRAMHWKSRVDLFKHPGFKPVKQAYLL